MKHHRDISAFHRIYSRHSIEFLFCSAHGISIDFYDILYKMLCNLCDFRVDVLYWHIHCLRVLYEIIEIIEQSLDIWNTEITSVKFKMYQVSFLLTFRIWKIFTIFIFLDIFIYLFMGLDYSVVYPFLAWFFSWLYLNENQISPYLAQKKWLTFCKQHIQMCFLKKVCWIYLVIYSIFLYQGPGKGIALLQITKVVMQCFN